MMTQGTKFINCTALFTPLKWRSGKSTSKECQMVELQGAQNISSSPLARDVLGQQTKHLTSQCLEHLSTYIWGDAKCQFLDYSPSSPGASA